MKSNLSIKSLNDIVFVILTHTHSKNLNWSVFSLLIPILSSWTGYMLRLIYTISYSYKYCMRIINCKAHLFQSVIAAAAAAVIVAKYFNLLFYPIDLFRIQIWMNNIFCTIFSILFLLILFRTFFHYSTYCVEKQRNGV